MKGWIMFRGKMPETRYYETFQDDFVESADQGYQIDENYDWSRDKFWQKGLSVFTFGLAKVLAGFYALVFHVRVENKDLLKPFSNKSYYLYGNHTQPFGDAVGPFRVITGRRFATIVSPANLGIPVLGKLLPYGGVIPTPSSRKQMKQFIGTMQKRTAEKQPVVIYPEEHVWPYYTKIRPFPLTAFHYPAYQQAPVFCMTRTYQKRRFSKRPKQTIYVDGPFLAPASLSPQKRQRLLRDQVAQCMQHRSKLSTYHYIAYERRND